MKQLIILSIILATNLMNAQKNNNYFSLYKGGKLHEKSTKYILFNSEDTKMTDNKTMYFHIKGQMFKHPRDKYALDTLNCIDYKKIELTNVQQLFKDEEKINKAYYSIINSIVLQDTIISDIQENIWKNRIEKKKSTLEQVEKSRQRLIANSCYLELKQYNGFLIKDIRRELRDKRGRMFNYFGSESLLASFNKIPEEKYLDSNLIHKSIKIIKNKNHYGHLFSSPIIIKNKLIISHVHFTGKNIATSEILMYSINKKGEPKLEDKFHLSFS